MQQVAMNNIRFILSKYFHERFHTGTNLTKFVDKTYAMNLKSLAKDTALYGLSSIVGRFLNYLLVPLYTYYISAQSGGYGIVTNLYAYTALLLVLLTFGMETTLFRFGSKAGEDGKMVYSTTLRLVGAACLVFIVAIFAFIRPISAGLGYALHPEYIACMALIVAQDAFQAIMFSRLRQQKKPLRFVALKFAFIVPNIVLNLGLFVLLPKFFGGHPGLEAIWQRFDYGVGFIFFINLLCTTGVSLLFLPEAKGLLYGYDKALSKRLLRYTWPLLLLGLVGILNQVADKILFPWLVPGAEGKVQLGIYGACAKIALILSVLTQAFRYAYEPIVFASGRGSQRGSEGSGQGEKGGSDQGEKGGSDQREGQGEKGGSGQREGQGGSGLSQSAKGAEASKSASDPQTLRDGMKFFIIFALLAFLGVVFYLPLLRYLVDSSYWEGLGVVPIVMMAEIFMGIYFNLSFWYKLSDQTIWGAIMSAAGAAVMIGVNIAFVPRYGYVACAWGGFAGYGVAMLLSFLIGQKKNPIAYDLRSAFMAFALALLLFGASMGLRSLLGVDACANMTARTIAYLGANTLLLGVYALFVLKSIKKSK